MVVTPARSVRSSLRMLSCLVIALAPSVASADLELRLEGAAGLRAEPRLEAPVVELLGDGETAWLVGPAPPPWLLVRSTSGRTGFLVGALEGDVIRPDEALVSRPILAPPALELYTEAVLREGPTAGHPLSGRIAPGGVARVLDQYGAWVLLATADGTSGWVDLATFVAAESSDVPTLPAPDAEPAAGEEEAERVAARAAKKIEQAAKEDERAERRAAKEAERAAKEAERAERRAAKEAERAAKEAERAERRAAKRAKKEARLEAEGAAKRARLEETRAREGAEEAAEKTASKAEPGAEAGSGPAGSFPAPAAPEARDAARSQEREAAREPSRRASAAAPRLPERERPEREQPARPAPPSSGVEPVAIPPGLGVELGDKPPSERKPDPARSPLVQEPVPAAAGEPVLAQAPSAPAPRGAGTAGAAGPAGARGPSAAASPPRAAAGFEPYDPEAQLGRSVSLVHEDREEALGLSRQRSEDVELGSSGYVNEAGSLVDTRVVSEIVVRVGPEIVSSAEFDRRVDKVREEERRRGNVRGPEWMRREAMRQLVSDLLLMNQARALGMPLDRIYEGAKEEFKKSSGIESDIELLRYLEDAGMSWNDFRRELVRSRAPWLVLKNEVLDQITVAEDEVESYYRRHEAEWASEECVRLREIVLQPEPRETTRDFNLRLQEILSRLYAGEDFCDIARRHSEAPSAERCGELQECFTFDQLDEKVALVAFKMRPGDIEPIRTEWGHHVLRLEEHRTSSVKSLEEVRDEIVKTLRRERLNTRVPAYIEELRSQTSVEVSPSYRAYYEGSERISELGQ